MNDAIYGDGGLVAAHCFALHQKNLPCLAGLDSDDPKIKDARRHFYSGCLSVLSFISVSTKLTEDARLALIESTAQEICDGVWFDGSMLMKQLIGLADEADNGFDEMKNRIEILRQGVVVELQKLVETNQP